MNVRHVTLSCDIIKYEETISLLESRELCLDSE